MQCPTDGSTLTMSERSGIEIDYCPTCRGVWLDRGELDKIIERSLGQAPAPAAPQAPAPQYQQPHYQDRNNDRDRDSYGSSGQPYRKKRKESWLSELFD